eukprot:14347238-Alexandrium_andersonii.AAC.1
MHATDTALCSVGNLTLPVTDLDEARQEELIEKALHRLQGAGELDAAVVACIMNRPSFVKCVDPMLASSAHSPRAMI